MARTLIKAREGDTVLLRAPAGNLELEVISVTYAAIEIDPFVPVLLDVPSPNAGT